MSSIGKYKYIFHRSYLIYFNILPRFRSLNLSYFKCNKYRNPFKKAIAHRGLKIDEVKEATRVCATVLGNGALGHPQCLAIFTDHKGILFNCGEGVGRILREYEGCFYLIKYIFITQRKWENLSGIADIHITHETYGIRHLNLFGPPGVEYCSMLNTGEINYTKLVKRDFPYIDNSFEIRPICISGDRPLKAYKRGTKADEDVAISYSFKIFEKPPELSPEKLIAHNVPFGPYLTQLRNGEDVLLPSGKIIQTSDVVESLNKREYLLIVDCPEEQFLLPFVTSGEFYKFQLPSGNHCKEVSTIFHFSPPHVMKTKLYKDWMKMFHPDTQHVILNASCPHNSSHAVHQSQSIFHVLHPDIFKLLPTSKTHYEDYGVPSVIHAPTMLQLHFRPKKEINWNTVLTYDPGNYKQETNCFPNFIEEVNKMKSFAADVKFSANDTTKYPELLFLGTGSATSTAFRNVTGIILNLSNTKSILLDCGEGTYRQFVRYFGPDMVDEELRKLSCIFVSHLHTDHYLGLFQLLNERVEAFKKSNKPYERVALILPYRIQKIFKSYCMIFEDIQYTARIFLCNSLKNEKKLENLRRFLGDLQVETVNVKHCDDSHGIVLKKGKDWKIVYSGDSAPCQALIDAGQNCTLLIHEASIEDGCLNEAMTKKHSTPSQVLDIAEKMNAQHTIMTHFSKRYLAVPVVEPTCNKHVGYAFDFMKVQLSHLPLIPHFMPAIKCLFQEQLENHAVRTSFFKNFENSFQKLYKQTQR